MTVAEMVAALPEVSVGHLGAGAASALAIALEDDGPWAPLLPGARGNVLLQLAPVDALGGELDRYVNVDGYEVEVPFEVSEHGLTIVRLSWPAPPGVRPTPGPRRLRAMSDVGLKVNDRWYLIPRLGDAGTAPHRLMIWWALLYALSSLARYEPAEWVAALDVDRSLLAVDLESTLATAEATVPVLIAEALGGSGGLPHEVKRDAHAELARSSEEQQPGRPTDG